MPVLLWQAVLCWPWLDTSHSWSLSVPPLLSWAGGSAPLQAAGKSLLWCWNTSSFAFFTDLGICWAVSFMYFLLSLLLPVVQVGFSYPFLKGTTTMADGSVVGPSWSPMSLAPSDTVGISGSFPQNPPPLQPSNYQNLAVQTQNTSLGMPKFIQRITVWVIR